MTKYCDKCGAELKEGNKFCDKCGNKVMGINDTSYSNQTTYSCPYCGKTIPYSVKCPYCGKSLQNDDVKKAGLGIIGIIILFFLLSGICGFLLLLFA